jgi:acyl dehydratase
MLSGYSFRRLEAFAGCTLGTSAWAEIDQARIDAFADCSDDRQWIHVDRERASRESPLGCTIAHGLLLLSLLPRFSYEVGLLPTDATHALNYGYDKVRFLAPVPAGARVRDVVVLQAVERKAPDQALVDVLHTVQLESASKPALVARALVLLFGPEPSGEGR